MPTNKPVSVNGRAYDPITGMPLQSSVEKPAPRSVATAATTAGSVHSAPQRSQTLHRRATKKPGLPKRPQTGQHMDIARSKAVTRFAPHPQVKAPAAQAAAKPVAKPTAVKADIAPRPHPIAKKAITKKSTAAATSQQIKNAEINRVLSAPITEKIEKPAKKRRFNWSRKTSIASAITAVVIVAGIVTYLNLPTLSVSVAGAQAGVEATFPKYTPDGFRLAQPVGFKEGEVSLTFNSTSNDSGYTIKQAASSWESTAVLDNVVRKKAGENYTLNQEKGLSIYVFDGDAAWVDRGILITIDSEAPLSNDQIRRIANSL